MTRVFSRRRTWSALLSLTLAAGLAQPAFSQVVAKADAVGTVAGRIWPVAASGNPQDFDAALARLAADGSPLLRDSAAALREHFQGREKARAARMDEVKAELAKAQAEPESEIQLSKVLRSTLELHVLTPDKDKDAFLATPDVRKLVERGEAAARQAEARGDVLVAGELFVLLDLLEDIKGTYRRDVMRLSQRQDMLRMYAPHRLWELRDARQKAAGEKPLPPYNSFADDWQTKVSSIDEALLQRTVWYAERHVTQPKASDLLRGGLEAVRTMVTTQDLVSAFPGLTDETARTSMLSLLDQVDQDISRLGVIDNAFVARSIDRIVRQNERSTKIDKGALLHEFGNGVIGRLDEFSKIIWPDEVRKFQKDTQGHFIGVGIQIEYDELQNIRVVSPIEGTPAQRAGIRPMDVITKVNEKAIFGLSLDQAVDVITGPEGTSVKVCVERAVEGAPEGTPKQELTFDLRRSRINVATVKGWKRTGAKEDQWDWFIDRENHIGYVRLHQFADSTSNELDRAAAAMKKEGLSALILDLRFNPGGLLDQAVKVSRRFVDKEKARIVSVQGQGGQLESTEFSEPSQATLAGIPVIVLVNEGSASASEIVSGCLAANRTAAGLDVLVLGSRSYGKGSVQNVWPIPPESMMKVTTGYYMLPDGRIIHRKPGATTWGVEPNLKIEMLPKQTSEAILLRRNADVVPMDEKGVIQEAAPRPDPQDLLTKGNDLQLETALLLLRARVAESGPRTAQSTPEK